MSFAHQIRTAHAHGVRTAWADPEHVRLAEGDPEERVNPKLAERLHAPDPDDPWTVPVPREGEQ